MIGKSFPELIFIRVSIFCLRSIPTIATLYTAYQLATLGLTLELTLPSIRDYWLYSECLFHIFFYLPRAEALQTVQVSIKLLPSHLPIESKVAFHPPLASRTQRRALFERCLSNLHDFNRFASIWFQTNSSTEIKRDNFKDWLLWALFSTDHQASIEITNPAIDEELNEYLDNLESFAGRQIEPGRNSSINIMRLTLDPVDILPRPLVWYAIVATVDIITYITLYTRGFTHYSLSLWARVFPPRPQAILSRRSPAQIPYWYRPHRSGDKLPVIMLHGVGIGLWPYLPFLDDIKRANPDTGILALEILPVSMRITDPMMSREQFIEQLTQILALHQIAQFVLVSHSFGSVLTTQILRSSLAPRVASIMLIDPVTLLLHLGDVASNFVYRKPKTANQWQLWYFASRDIGVSHTFSRHFFWRDNILWKEDLERRKVVVVLSGEDQIVNTREVWRYLTSQKHGEPTETWEDETGCLNVLWYKGLDHAQIFDTPGRRKPVVDLLKEVIRAR